MISERAKKLILRVAEHESGGKFDAINPDDNGAGVSYGLIQFNQKKGSLPNLLLRMNRNDPIAFDTVFGPFRLTLLEPDDVRAMDLSPVIPRLKQAAGVKAFQEAQFDIAFHDYFLPVLDMSKKYMVGKEKSLGVLLDSAVQNGPGKTRGWLKQAASDVGVIFEPLEREKKVMEKFIKLADAGPWAGNRRRKIWEDSRLSFEASSSPVSDVLLKFRTRGPEVEKLNEELGRMGLLEIDEIQDVGFFGMSTQRAVKRFQEIHGLDVDGIVGSKTFEFLRIYAIDFRTPGIRKPGLNATMDAFRERYMEEFVSADTKEEMIVALATMSAGEKFRELVVG